jgi:dihydrofolate reductase
MAKLLYVMNVSLDGYIADEDGNFDWGAPDEGYYSFINDLERPVGTYLYGRRLYELMAVWETDPAAAAGGRQGRVFQDAGGGRHHQDADRAGLRPRGGPATEGGSRA